MISRTNLFGLIALGVAWYNMSSGPEIGKVIETQSGSMEGTASYSRDGRKFYEWLGIPYAKPPVGDLRFQSPHPIDPWGGVLDATAYRSDCAAIQYITAEIVGDEDCLFLNVHTPELTIIGRGSTDLLPVVIYIHGGAFMQGSGREIRPDFFMDEDVVFVTFNYRLGVLGFLSTGDDIIKGNMGLKDQVLAIQWVNNNIQAFGGDPNQITILGDCAGAASVHYHMLSWQTKGMFQKAAMVSGAAGSSWSFIPLEKAVRTSKAIARRLKCTSGDTEEIAGCLRDLEVATLLGAIAKDMREIFLFKPHLKGEIIGPTLEVFDDEDAFMTHHPFKTIQKGKFQKVPLLAGVMADEGLASAYPFLSDEDNFLQFEVNMTESIRRLCLYSSTSPVDERIAEQIRDYYFFNRKAKISDAERPLKLIELFSDCFYNKHVSRAVEYQRLHANTYIFYFNMKGGPSKTDLMTSLDSTFGYYKYLATYYIQSVLGESILGSHDYGVNHGDHLPFLFPMDLMSKIHKDHSLYTFSKSWVKFFVDFVSNNRLMLRFGGVNVPPQAKTGPLMYFEVNRKPKLLKQAPFESRLDFLKSIGML